VNGREASPAYRTLVQTYKAKPILLTKLQSPNLDASRNQKTTHARLSQINKVNRLPV
jgi:hypothetical protein